MELLNIQIGQTVYDYCHYIDEERVRIAERQTYANTRKSRLCVGTVSGSNEETFFDAEDLLYGPGIAEIATWIFNLMYS